MKTYEQRTQDIQAKVKRKKTQRKAITAGVCGLCCIAFALILFYPKNPQPTDISAHQNKPHYPLIEALQKLTYQAPGYKNNFDLLFGDVLTQDSIIEAPGAAPEAAVPDAGMDSNEAGYSGTYEETTDLQVQGVGEADIIKRSSTHIYYLHGNTLRVYTIDGENSKEVGSFCLTLGEGYRQYGYSYEMYLSQDCATVTVLTECFQKDSSTSKKRLYAVNLDVSNPESIRQTGLLAIDGDYLSSRLVDGKLYLLSRYYVNSTPDFEDEATYLPGYEADGEMHYLPMDSIVIPENPTSAMYTVVSKVDSKTLEMEDTAALLSYYGTEYVSQNNFFLTRGYTETETNDQHISTKNMTEIAQIRYTGEGLEYVANFHVEGSINNQYNLDEKDGILRVVTTTRTRKTVEKTNGEYSYATFLGTSLNASLYCIDLSDHSVRASVENFAPEGEDVKSVRFDGDKAYVCTSVMLTDPVFFFDLSDLDNITYKDTGTISGYSMSLVNFQDGFLMGIGYGDSFSDLKIEMYREGESTVEPYCSYEIPNCYFSTDYKSYYIDRENGLIGLGINDYDALDPTYVVIGFDGYELTQVWSVNTKGNIANMRGVFIDEYMYVLSEEFHVDKLGTSSVPLKEHNLLVLSDDGIVIHNELKPAYAAGEIVTIKLETITEHYYLLTVNGVEQEMNLDASDMMYTYFTFIMPDDPVTVEIKDCWVSIPEA